MISELSDAEIVHMGFSRKVFKQDKSDTSLDVKWQNAGSGFKMFDTLMKPADLDSTVFKRGPGWYRILKKKSYALIVLIRSNMGLDVRKPVFGDLGTTKAQTSLRICAVWSAPLLFAYWKVSYLDLLQTKFQFSS